MIMESPPNTAEEANPLIEKFRRLPEFDALKEALNKAEEYDFAFTGGPTVEEFVDSTQQFINASKESISEEDAEKNGDIRSILSTLEEVLRPFINSKPVEDESGRIKTLVGVVRNMVDKIEA